MFNPFSTLNLLAICEGCFLCPKPEPEINAPRLTEAFSEQYCGETSPESIARVIHCLSWTFIDTGSATMRCVSLPSPMYTGVFFCCNTLENTVKPIHTKCAFLADAPRFSFRSNTLENVFSPIHTTCEAGSEVHITRWKTL